LTCCLDGLALPLGATAAAERNDRLPVLYQDEMDQMLAADIAKVVYIARQRRLNAGRKFPSIITSPSGPMRSIL